MTEQGFFTNLVQEVSIRLRIIFLVFLLQSQIFYSNSLVVEEDIAKIHVSKMVIRNGLNILRDGTTLIDSILHQMLKIASFFGFCKENKSKAFETYSMERKEEHFD